jgi:hypothetical protein
MTKHELRQKLTAAIADMYLLEVVLDHAVRAGVPPDATHVVQLDTIAKQLCSILVKLDEREPTVLEESA